MKRKILGVIVCLTLVFALVSPVAVNATGTANDVVNVAHGEIDTSIGYKQQEFNGYTKYGDWLGNAYMDWCAAFVAWCANQAGVSSDVVPHYSFVNDMISFYSNRGLYKSAGSYTPKAGDLAFLSGFDHVAIVVSATSSRITTIEGNTTTSNFTGDTVYVSKKTRGISYFKGFATPNYADTNPNPPSNPRLQIYDKYVPAGAAICFEYSCNNADRMYIAIDVDGIREHFIEVSGDHYNGTFTKSGHYAAALYAYNSAGESGYSNWVEFDVYNTAPSNCKIQCDKTTIYAGESVNFSVSAKYATEYQLGMFYNGNRIWLASEKEYFTSKSVVFQNAGEYVVYVSSYNGFGYCDSEKITITVKEKVTTTPTPPTVAPATPTLMPTAAPTTLPTSEPTTAPTTAPTAEPTAAPTTVPTTVPTAEPTTAPTAAPTTAPTEVPTSTLTPTPAQSVGYPYEINELSLKTESGAELSEAPVNAGFIVNAKFTKLQQRTETDYMFVAVYDAEGALLSLDYVQADFAENYTYNVGFYIPPQKEKIGTVKAFVWNTFNSMTPLAESKKL